MTATISEQAGQPVSGGATGRIARVIGPVVDVEFPEHAVPGIYNALTAQYELNGEKRTITFETAQHLGDNMIRAVSLQPRSTQQRVVPSAATPTMRAIKDSHIAQSKE